MSGPDPKTLARLQRSVRFTEGFPTDLVGKHQAKGPIRPGFWAKITGEPTAGAYSWKRQIPDGAGSFEDDPDNVTGTATAFEVNATEGIATGTFIHLSFAGFNGSGEPIFTFTFGGSSLPAGGEPYQVLSASGDPSTPPFWDWPRLHSIA